jgi:hypothetical protein
VSGNTTDHERAAMEAAIKETFDLSTWSETYERLWEAAREYEPPAVCGDQRGLDSCYLPSGHGGDHRKRYGDGSYIGWPREQEPDPDERCVGLGYINGIKFKTRCGVPRREHMYVSSHAFISAKEATK